MLRVTLISGGLGLGLAVTALGCSKEPKGSRENAGAPKASAGSAGSAAPKRSATVAPKGPSKGPQIQTDSEREALESEAEDKRFEREFLIARKRMSQKDYAKAIEHFTSALSNGRNDARCLGERGYAYWLLKEKGRAKSDFWDAAGASPESDVAGQVWYNLGLVFEDEGDAEMSRASFALSYAMGKSGAAKAKLGGRSACQSAIISGMAAEGDTGSAVVRGWLGVHRQFQLEGAPKSESEAKNVVCHTVSRAMGGPPEDAEGVCTGDPPWELSCCALTGGFIFRRMWLVPGQQGSFFTLDAGLAGSWPRECRSYPQPTLKIEGQNIIVTTEGSETGPNGDFAAKHPDSIGLSGTDEPPCREGPGGTTVSVYSRVTGKRRLFVRSYATSTPPTITLDGAGTEATISGNECDVKVKL